MYRQQRPYISASEVDLAGGERPMNLLKVTLLELPAVCRYKLHSSIALVNVEYYNGLLYDIHPAS